MKIRIDHTVRGFPIITHRGATPEQFDAALFVAQSSLRTRGLIFDHKDPDIDAEQHLQFKLAVLSELEKRGQYGIDLGNNEMMWFHRQLEAKHIVPWLILIGAGIAGYFLG